MMSKEGFLALSSLLATAVIAGGGEIIPRNSTWKFLPGGSEASSPVSAWRNLNFTDSEFSDSPAPFWYGDPYPGGTQISGMRYNYSCIFLRHTFTVANVAEIGALRLGAFADDGFIAWINGVEVQRVRVSTSNPTYETLASNASEPPPFTIYELPSPSNYLNEGLNVLAVQHGAFQFGSWF